MVRPVYRTQKNTSLKTSIESTGIREALKGYIYRPYKNVYLTVLCSTSHRSTSHTGVDSFDLIWILAAATTVVWLPVLFPLHTHTHTHTTDGLWCHGNHNTQRASLKQTPGRLRPFPPLHPRLSVVARGYSIYASLLAFDPGGRSSTTS